VIGGLITFWTGMTMIVVDPDSSGWWFLATGALWGASWFISRLDER
jgi:hypothetical protein